MPKNFRKYEGQEVYVLKFRNLTRLLPIVSIGDEVSIASFVMLGDTELIEYCAAELTLKIKSLKLNFNFDFDYIVVPEAKGIPLAHALCRNLSAPPRYKNCIVLRKNRKAYMEDCLLEELKSVTTFKKQSLFLTLEDAKKIKHKGVLIVDDVFSTGETLKAASRLVERSGAEIAGALAVLIEGDFDASKLGFDAPLIYLECLPIFLKPGFKDKGSKNGT